MAQFIYTGDDGRHYPDLGRVFDNGDEFEADDAPDDGRFSPAKPAKQTKPEGGK